MHCAKWIPEGRAWSACGRFCSPGCEYDEWWNDGEHRSCSVCGGVIREPAPYYETIANEDGLTYFTCSQACALKVEERVNAWPKE